MQQLVSENTNRFADNFGLNLTLIDILALWNTKPTRRWLWNLKAPVDI
jgi:hypothetical protein